MPSSDLRSAIDDSFDIAVRHSGRQTQEADVNNCARSGHWSVSDGTALGSGIDDDFDPGFNLAGASSGAIAYGADNPIPGSVFRRFTKTNASERKRQQEKKALPTVDEENVESAHANAHNAPKHKEEGSRFKVPRIGIDQRGICIKSKDGRCQIIREPSLPPFPQTKPKPSSPAPKDSPHAETNDERVPSPNPSDKGAKIASPAPKSKDVVRIVGRDGRKTFKPLPGDLDLSNDVRRGQRPEKTTSPAQKETAEKIKKARDAKATKAAEEVRRETETADLFMSGAIVGSVAVARSGMSSTTFVRDKSARQDWAQVDGGDAAPASKRPPSVKGTEEAIPPASKPTKPGKKQNSPGKSTKKPHEVNKNRLSPEATTKKPKSAPASKQTNKEDAQENPSPNPPASEPKQPSPPPSRPRSNASTVPSHAPTARMEARHESPAPVSTTKQTVSVRTASKVPSNASAARSQAQGNPPIPAPATWQPPSVRTASHLSQTCSSGRISNPSFKGGQQQQQQQFANDNYIASYYPPAFVEPSGFHQIASAIYEPGRVGPGSKVRTIGSDLESTPSARDQLRYTSGQMYPMPYPVPANSGIKYEQFAGVRNPHFVPATVASGHGSQHSRASSFAHSPPPHVVQDRHNRLEIGYSRAASASSLQHIKQESGTPSHHNMRNAYVASGTSSGSQSQRSIKEEFGDPSPQLIHGFNLPSEASSRSFPQPSLSAQPSPRQTSGYYSASLAGPVGVMRSVSLRGSLPHAPPLLQYHSPAQRHSPSRSQQTPPRVPNTASYVPSPQPSYQWSPTQQNDSPTIYAGRGWISPHPLSVASSEISDAPQSAICLPTAHHVRRNGASANAVPGALTYDEWRAVQEQQSVLSEVAQAEGELNLCHGSRHESSSWTRSSEILRRDAEGQGSGDRGSLRAWVDRPRTNWSRTTSSHAREDRSGRNWGLEATGTVRSDGRVQLKMPWDQ